MIKTVEQGLDCYKQALRNYKREKDRFIRRWRKTGETFIHGVDDEPLQNLWDSVDAMAKVLGLSKAEKKSAMLECGLKNGA